MNTDDGKEVPVGVSLTESGTYIDIPPFTGGVLKDSAENVLGHTISVSTDAKLSDAEVHEVREVVAAYDGPILPIQSISGTFKVLEPRFPSPEEMDAIALDMEARAYANPTCLSNWRNVIRSGLVPVPETHFIHWPHREQRNFIDALESVGRGFDDVVATIPSATRSKLYAAYTKVSSGARRPAFIRTGLFSGKHSWAHTCFIPTPAEGEDVDFTLFTHLAHLKGDEMVADFGGELVSNWIVVREFLHTDPALRVEGFAGMPVSRERRVFVKSGVVQKIIPYWPEEALDNHGVVSTATGEPLDDEVWRRYLRQMNEDFVEGEEATIRGYAETISKMRPGHWSLDFMWVPSRGWVFIDAAEARRSYGYTEDLA